MHDQTDSQLLCAYAENRSDAAFAELVRRHLDFVYSAARRMVCDSHLAEDVSQGVFVALAKSAGQLTDRPVLSGWLHRTAQNIAAQTVRTDVRRRNREQEAVAMNELLANETDAPWEDIAPQLDAALGELEETDRDALLLRYFEHKSAQEIAEPLGISAEAAQKRVSRAVERLRELFAKRGVTAGAGGLAVIISAHAVQAAPAGLAAAISSTAIAAGTVAVTSTAMTVAKTIAMTTLQKTAIALALAAAVGTAIYEQRQASTLQNEVSSLQQQLASAQKLSDAALNQARATPPAKMHAPVSPPVAVKSDTDWAAQLLALNTNDWRQAFAIGQELAALPPDAGLAILRTNWAAVTNASARQQLLKAFCFALHERLPAVLDLAVHDSSPEVQSWALNYLKQVALQDFTSNYSAAENWLDNRRDTPLATAFADAVWQAANNLHGGDPATLAAQLSLLKNAGSLLTKFPDAVNAAALPQVFADLIKGNDPQVARLALESADAMPFSDDWRREVALPRLAADNSWELRLAAANALGGAGRDWAVQPLLDTLSDAVHSGQRPDIWGLARPLAETGSARAIPTMIALIDADNTYDTVYGIGYFGLGKLTGVNYDEKHDGAWWRQWWNENKQRFPADVQSLEIPQVAPIKR